MPDLARAARCLVVLRNLVVLIDLGLLEAIFYHLDSLLIEDHLGR